MIKIKDLFLLSQSKLGLHVYVYFLTLIYFLINKNSFAVSKNDLKHVDKGTIMVSYYNF
jgi:hypothetical protein